MAIQFYKVLSSNLPVNVTAGTQAIYFTNAGTMYIAKNTGQLMQIAAQPDLSPYALKSVQDTIIADVANLQAIVDTMNTAGVVSGQLSGTSLELLDSKGNILSTISLSTFATTASLNSIASTVATLQNTVTTNSTNIGTLQGQVASINSTLPKKADLVNGVVPISQLPSFLQQQTSFYVVAAEIDKPTTNITTGSQCYVVATGNTYVWNGTSWIIINSSSAYVTVSQFTPVQQQVTTNTSDIAALNGEIDTVNQNISDVGDAVQTLSNNYTALSSQVNTIDGRVTTLEVGFQMSEW